MKPRNVTQEDAAFWEAQTGVAWSIGPMLGRHVGAEDVESVLKSRGVVKVAWVRDERDGGEPEEGVTVWTTFWGGMLPTDVVIVHHAGATGSSES